MKAVRNGYYKLLSVDGYPFPDKFLEWAQTWFGGSGDEVNIKNDDDQGQLDAAFDLWLHIYEKEMVNGCAEAN